MTRKPLLLAVAALAAAAAAAGAGLSAGKSVTITTPTQHTRLSARHDAYLAIAGTAAFADTSVGSTRFYLRRDGCGSANDNPHLSVVSGTDAGDGCGLVLNGVTGLGGDADQSAFVDFPASDGMPLSLDGTQPIQGRVALTGAQVGLAEVDVTLDALVGGQPVEIGSATGTAVLDPTGADTPVPFAIQPNLALDGADVQALDLRVRIHGPNVYSGFMALSGESWVDLPSHAASVNEAVEVSVDDPTFADAVPARLDGSDWSLAIATPAAGTHTLYARSTQGYDTSAVANTTFKVSK